jgi:hypothetical protein
LLLRLVAVKAEAIGKSLGAHWGGHRDGVLTIPIASLVTAQTDRF